MTPQMWSKAKVGLRKSLICATAIVGVSTVACADELQDLKAQAAALEQQNQALMQRIDEIGRAQGNPGFGPSPSTPPSGTSGSTGTSGSAGTSGSFGSSAAGLIGNFFGGGAAPPPSGGGTTASGQAPTVTESRTGNAGTAAQAIGGTQPIPAAYALTYLGVTLYGAIDTGVSYQTHGNPLSDVYGPGLEYVISKNSNRSQVSLAPNALSYSNIGIRGLEPIFSGVSAVFNLQTQFLPTSGNIVNNLGSLTQNNGVALNKQSSSGDSTRAGQAFQIAYAGLTSDRLGTITFGRQNTFSLDGVIAYDPMYASNAFSLIGYNGLFAGAGDTEDSRLDGAIKYIVNYGPIHGGAFYEVGGGNGSSPSGTGIGAGRNAYQFDLGSEYRGLDLDAIYSQIYDAVSASALSAAQVPTAPLGSLASSISDNRTLMLLAKYKFGRAQVFFGYENIYYHNPRDPLAVDSQGLNNYVLGVVNNTAYTDNKLLQTFWGGVRYGVTKKLYLDAAYYREHQSSYSGNGCTNTSLPTCRGDLNAYSLLATYLVAPRFDIYAGAMLSTVSGGLASGFINNTTIDPTIGGRISF